MFRSRMLFASLALIAAFGIGAATSLAQRKRAAQEFLRGHLYVGSHAQTMTNDVSKWTRKQWHTAK